MNARPPPAGLTEDDFERIEAAVMETERGRWFLLEFARRARSEVAGAVAESLARMEVAIETAAACAAPSFEPSALRDIEERLQDLAWRLQAQRAEPARDAVLQEIAALRALRSAPGPARRLGPACAADQPEAGGDLTQRLLTLDELGRNGFPALAAGRPALDQPVPGAPFAAIDRLPLAEKLAYFE